MINYQDFIHPEDDAARRQMEAIPGFQTVTKYFMELGLEKMLHGLYMAEKIRLSPEQLPELYQKLPPICEKFNIAEPEFYLEMNPFPNAYTIGDKQTFLVVTSGLLDSCNDDEVTAVIAHECGHILCRHVFYRTVAGFFLSAIDALGLVGNLAVPIEYALNYWSRRSELSADRAGLVYAGNYQPMVNALLRLTGGPEKLTGKINLQAYADQAGHYYELQEKSMWHKLLQSVAVLKQDHPFPAVRIKELMKWSESTEYQRLHKAMQEYENMQKCPSCSRLNEKENKFCRYCGTSMKGDL